MPAMPSGARRARRPVPACCLIAELAARLPPEQEIEVTTDPDQILALAPASGCGSSRPAVRAARQAPVDRRAVVVALAEEIDALQQADRRRVAAHETAAQPFLQACRAADVSTLPLRLAHARMVEMAERLLPRAVDWEDVRADAQ
jgi:predicted RNA-binding Zn ribbon-like protein